MKAQVSLSILLIVLAAGLGSRVMRSLTQQGGVQVQREEAQVERFMEARGWTIGERIAITANFDYAARVFRHETCRQALLVSVIGAGGDAGGLFKRMGGLQWRFMHMGAAYESPPSVRFMVDYGLALALRQKSPPSILAVAVGATPDVHAQGCDLLSPEDWRSFNEAAPPVQEGSLQDGLRTSAE